MRLVGFTKKIKMVVQTSEKYIQVAQYIYSWQDNSRYLLDTRKIIHLEM